MIKDELDNFEIQIYKSNTDFYVNKLNLVSDQNLESDALPGSGSDLAKNVQIHNTKFNNRILKRWLWIKFEKREGLEMVHNFAVWKL